MNSSKKHKISHKNQRIIALYCLLICLFSLHNVKAETIKNGFNGDSILSAFGTKIFASIKQYDYQHYNKLINSSRFLLLPSSDQKLLQSNWRITSTIKNVPSEKNVYEYVVKFKCISGKLSQASVSVELNFNNWSKENYVLMPSVAYNGNRYESRNLRYSPKLHDIKDIGADKPIIINDVPKLNLRDGISLIQERSGSMATPSIGFSSIASKKGIWLLTHQGNAYGDYGINIEENRQRTAATVSITSPIVREGFTYMICNAHNPSWDVPSNFKAGDSVVISFRLYPFNGGGIQSIFDKYAAIRKNYDLDTALNNTLAYSSCIKTLEQKFNAKNYVEKYGYYAVGMRENYLQDWQIGWTGGMISTYPLLFAGNDTTTQHVIKNFDWLFPNGISPSGFYWDAGRNGTEWIGGDIRNAHTKNWHLVRKSGDAVWYIIKQFLLMEKKGIVVKEQWKSGNKKVCDAFVQLWKKYHQLGQFVDSNTGDIIVGGSTSGAIVPAALMLASVYYKEPEYAKIAEEIANYYDAQFIQKGISCGGPGDALQAFDSESTYGLVESFVTLYELTTEKKWLTIAENVAKQFSTWVVGYNYSFKDTAAFKKIGIKTVGSVYANVQNKHSSPGICTASGIGLLKLYRFTGDVFYLNLLCDIAHNITQYMPHPKRPIENTPVGWVSERINMSDWEGPQTIGYILPISTWAETSLMLTTVEIPSVYVQPSKGIYKAFDNVIIQKVSETADNITLQIKNPTPEDAEIVIMIDNDEKSFMGENYLYGKQKFTIKSNAIQSFTFKK